jgi:hypothetical protein
LHGYINFLTIDDLRQRLLDRYLRIGLESGGRVPLPPDHLFQTGKEGSSWKGGGPIQLPFIPQDSTIANNYRQYQDSAGIEMDSMRNPPTPAKQSRLQSDSNSLFGKDSGLSEGLEHTELTLPLLNADRCNETIVKQATSQHREWLQPKAQDIPAVDLRKMLSQHQRPDKPSVMINGVEYIAKLNDVMYQVSNHKQTMLPLALNDHGTNGGVAGSDTCLIDQSLHSVHIQGIDDHMIKDIPIGTVGAVINTQRGDVIAIMHQYVYTGKGGTIHSSGQLKWCGNDVNDRSIKIEGGTQRLTTPDGYIIPIDVRRGLPYIMMWPFTDEEFKELPAHVVWTSEDDWDPTSLDSVISNDPNWYGAEPSPPLPDPMYDEYG